MIKAIKKPSPSERLQDLLSILLKPVSIYSIRVGFILISLLFKRLEKIKGLDSECLERVNSQYPRFKELIDIVNEFKKMLLDKNVGRMERWIRKASSLNISEINSFITGITRDITAVKNSIKYEYNNGLAEGSVNKLKVVKRIMYGRNSFEMLRKKLLRQEKNHKFN